MKKIACSFFNYHICGVISDKVVKQWLSNLICSYDERKAVIESNMNVDVIDGKFMYHIASNWISKEDSNKVI